MDSAISTREERLAAYSLEEQWRIFLYGTQEIHPPVKGLAGVLARQGEPALRFVLSKLESTRNYMDYVHSMLVFQKMQWNGYSAICTNSEVMAQIRANQQKIGDTEWRKIYANELAELCNTR